MPAYERQHSELVRRLHSFFSCPWMQVHACVIPIEVLVCDVDRKRRCCDALLLDQGTKHPAVCCRHVFLARQLDTAMQGISLRAGVLDVAVRPRCLHERVEVLRMQDRAVPAEWYESFIQEVHQIISCFQFSKVAPMALLAFFY